MIWFTTCATHVKWYRKVCCCVFVVVSKAGAAPVVMWRVVSVEKQAILEHWAAFVCP